MEANGIVVPIVTPVDETGRLDEKGLRTVIDHVVDGGVDGVFLAGTTGEFARLSDHDRHALFSIGSEAVAGRATVYAGISDAELSAVHAHTRAAEEAGVDALVITLPYYFHVKNDEEALVWFSRIIERAKAPLVLYNIPGNVGSDLTPTVVERLAPSIVGLKDSSGSLDCLKDYFDALGGKDRTATLLCGSESLTLEAAKLGADGVVPSMANVFPELWAGIWKAWSDLDALAGMTKLVDEINAFNGKYDSAMGHLMWKKQALALLGICGPHLCPPGGLLSESDSAEIRRLIGRFGKVSA